VIGGKPDLSPGHGAKCEQSRSSGRGSGPFKLAPRTRVPLGCTSPAPRLPLGNLSPVAPMLLSDKSSETRATPTATQIRAARRRVTPSAVWQGGAGDQR